MANISEEEVLRRAIEFVQPETVKQITIWASSSIKAFVSETQTFDGWEVELSREPGLTTCRRECREGGQRCVTEYEDENNQHAILDTAESTIRNPDGIVTKIMEHVDLLEETFERVSFNIMPNGKITTPKCERGSIKLKEDYN